MDVLNTISLMISLSAPMCVPSNTVPSSKIKNAFILSSHSAAFCDVCISLSLLQYLQIAPLGICIVYDTHELLRCFAAPALLKTFGFHCILMFYDLNRHLPPRASTVGLCRLNLVSA